ncbi:MAG: hypothetical protein K2P78_05665, partial [Gemmataceae bacterium]|nr:hypothetical protein [Gemmataceae bacterium]
GLRATVVRVEAITGHDRTRVWVKLESTSPWVGRAPRDGIGLLEPAAPRPEGMTPRLTALDAAGLPVPPVASELLDVQDDGARTATLHEYQFAGGVPARLVVVGPRAAVVEVPFALADVPLP